MIKCQCWPAGQSQELKLTCFCLILGSYQGGELELHIVMTVRGMDAPHLYLTGSSQHPLVGATVLSPYLWKRTLSFRKIQLPIQQSQWLGEELALSHFSLLSSWISQRILPLGFRFSRKPTFCLFTSPKRYRAMTHLSHLGCEPENPAAWSISRHLQNRGSEVLLGIGFQPLDPALQTRARSQMHFTTFIPPALVQASVTSLLDNYESLTGHPGPP